MAAIKFYNTWPAPNCCYGLVKNLGEQHPQIRFKQVFLILIYIYGWLETIWSTGPIKETALTSIQIDDAVRTTHLSVLAKYHNLANNLIIRYLEYVII
jgi:hypothetical protein